MKQSVIISIKEGHVQNPTSFTKFIRGLKDGRFTLEASSLNKRSNQQNRYYFGLVVPLVQQGIKDLGTELTKEETHEFLKARFNLSDLTNKETGESISIPISTTRLNKEQFGEYIEKIQRFASEFLNVVIPDPGVQTIMSYDH